jgi:hypothetical protein
VKHEHEETQAGIERFKVFKQFNVLYAIAKTYTITPDEAFHIDYATALLTLQRTALEAQYQKKLNRILQDKQKATRRK